MFSLPYSIAVAITGVRPGPEWFTEEVMRNQKILDTAKKVRIIVDPNAENLFPKKWTAKVGIKTVEGEKYFTHVNCPRGEPENPMSSDEMEDKFMSWQGM